MYLSDCQCNEGYIRIADVIGATSVTSCVCPAGFEQLSAGSSYFCSPCRRGLFKSMHGNTLCTRCPFEHATSLELGAVSDEQCCCDIGYFMPSNVTSNSSSSAGSLCTACPKESTSCTNRGTTPPSIPLLPGYWRVHEWSVVMLPCFTQEACIGSNTTGTNTRDQFSTSLCAVGHGGVFCNTCEPNFVQTGSGECTECGGAVLLTILPAVLIVIILVMLVASYAASPAARTKMKRSMSALADIVHAHAEETGAKTSKLDFVTSAVDVRNGEGGDDQSQRPSRFSRTWSFVLASVARLTACQVKIKIIIVCSCLNPPRPSIYRL